MPLSLTQVSHRLAQVKWVRQLFLYGMVGGLATGADWGTFYILNGLLKVHYAFSTWAGLIVGSVVNFTLNRSLTFKKGTGPLVRQLATFIIVAATSMTLSTGWMYLFVDKLGLQAMVARVTTTFVMYLINFVLQKFLVFSA